MLHIKIIHMEHLGGVEAAYQIPWYDPFARSGQQDHNLIGAVPTPFGLQTAYSCHECYHN